jgi:hypothetical protein
MNRMFRCPGCGDKKATNARDHKYPFAHPCPKRFGQFTLYEEYSVSVEQLKAFAAGLPRRAS